MSNQIRSTRLTRKRFFQVKRELKKQMKDLGYTLKVRKQKVDWSATTPHVQGYFDEHKKLIQIYIIGRVGYAKILHYMAHELRHAIHAENGLYKDYYGLNIDLMFLAIEKNSNVQWKWPNLGVAIRAERDCDRWAHKFLEDRGITVVRDFVYPFEQTLAYKVTQIMKRYQQSKRVKTCG